MDNLAQSIRRLHDQIDAKNRDMTDFRNKLSGLITSIQSVLEPLRDKMERVAELTAQIGQLTEELAATKNENARLLEDAKNAENVKQQLQEAQKREAELLGQIGTLTDDLNREIANLDRGQTPSVALADQISALQKLQQELQGYSSSSSSSSSSSYSAPEEDLIQSTPDSNGMNGGWTPSFRRYRQPRRVTRRRSTRPRRSTTGKRLITF